MNSINIQFFASLREEVGKDKISLTLPAEMSAGLPVSEIVNKLAQQENAAWQSILEASDILVAVNQTLVDRDHCVLPGDEVAFLPPVTGG